MSAFKSIRYEYDFYQYKAFFRYRYRYRYRYCNDVIQDFSVILSPTLQKCSHRSACQILKYFKVVPGHKQVTKTTQVMQQHIHKRENVGFRHKNSLHLTERSREQHRKGSKQSIFLSGIDIFQRYPVSVISSSWYRYQPTLKNAQVKTVPSVGTVSCTDLTSFSIYAFMYDLPPIQ